MQWCINVALKDLANQVSGVGKANPSGSTPDT